MKYLKKQLGTITNTDSGFTIVEILVILLIIGILSTILVLTYSGVEVRQKNTTRIDDMKLIQSSLESFYAQSGFYPSLADMNSLTWTNKNLKSLDPSELQDPNNKSDSLRFTETPMMNQYSYHPTASTATSSCDNKTVACAHYILSATLGGNSGTFVEKSLN